MRKIRSTVLPMLVVGLSWTGELIADPKALTHEFLVNGEGAAGDQTNPKVCGYSWGYVVVWQGPGEEAEEIFARRYDPKGQPLGPRFQVNVRTYKDQVQPDVACRDDGSFVVVWKGPDLMAQFNTIFARTFDSAGFPFPDQQEVMVDSPSGEKTAPAVAYSSSGQILVAWQANNDGIFGRFLGSNANWLTPSTLINTTSAGNQQDPAVAFIKTPTGAFAVVWEGGVGFDIFLQRVSLVVRTFTLEGSELTVNSGMLQGVQENPDVAVSAITDSPATNRIAVVWQGPSGRIWYRLFDTEGVPDILETIVDTSESAGVQENPTVSMPNLAPELEVQPIITWTQNLPLGRAPNGDQVPIVGARRPRTLFSELWGAPPLNPEFEISERGPVTSNSDVALQPNGNFMAVWQSTGQDSSGEGIYARVFDANWLTQSIFADGFESGNTSAWLP